MRTKVFTLILCSFLVFLVAGLFSLQVVMYARYSVMSEENRLKVMPLMAPRGNIFDRNGEIMVKDVMRFNLDIIYSEIIDKGKLAKELSAITGLTTGDITSKIEECRWQRYTPVTILEDIGTERSIKVAEASSDYPGVMLEVSAKRQYVHGKTASNVLGYLGSINRSEFTRLKPYGYRVNDLIGRDGVEKYYDEYLRGKHGGKQIEVDHLGREITTLGLREPMPGMDLHLTIDLRLQEFSDSLLEGKRGAIVVMAPETGEILVMASAPAYDPTVFIDRSRANEIGGLLKDEKYPLLNRAISGQYPMGSVFKAVVMTGALEEKKATPSTTYTCPGYFALGKFIFHCWRLEGHGPQAMVDAIKNSCDVYFYNTGLLMGAEKIAEYARRFGLGENTGIDLPGENPGIIPDSEWKKKRTNVEWYKGDTANFAIGQGYMLSSPLQTVRMMAVFANGGYLVKPFIVEKVNNININTPAKKDLRISKGSLDNVRSGLKACVNSPTGTGQKAKLDGVVVAGKTGTSQTSKGKNHGWFAGFAPFDKPKLVIVVFDEYGGTGGYYAAGTAGKVLQKAKELGLL